DPKACLPGHHLRVGGSRLFQRDALDHGGDAAEHAEAQRCVTNCRRPCEGACYLALPEYEIHARDLDRLWSNSEVNGDASGTPALEGRRDCLASRSCYDNDLGAAKCLQSGCGVSSGTVNVVVSPELLGEFGRVAAAGNRRHLKPHMPGVLHGQMTKAPDTQHSHKIACLRRRVS